MQTKRITLALAVSASFVMPGAASALDIGVSVGGNKGINANASVGGGSVAEASASVGGGSGVDANASVGGGSVAEASASVGGSRGVDADVSVGGGSTAEASVSVGGSCGGDGGTSVGGGGGGSGGGTGGGVNVAVGGGSGSGSGSVKGTAKGTGTVANGNSPATLASLYVGRDVVTKDRMHVGRVAEIRASGTACPTLGIAPAATMDAGVDRFWIDVASCSGKSASNRPIRLSISSGALMRQLF